MHSFVAIMLEYSLGGTTDSALHYLHRAASIVSAVLATAILSVRVSLTRRYGVKTTARSTVQITPSDSKMCRNQKIFPRDDPFPLKSWLQVTYPLLIAARTRFAL